MPELVPPHARTQDPDQGLFKGSRLGLNKPGRDFLSGESTAAKLVAAVAPMLVSSMTLNTCYPWCTAIKESRGFGFKLWPIEVKRRAKR